MVTTSWIVPVSRPPIERGRVAIEGGRITWVGAPGDSGEPELPLEDLGPGILLPGLVNAHTHLELSHLADLRGLARGFVPWVEALVERRGELPAAEMLQHTARAIDALGRSGTVAVGDISNTLVHLDLLAASGLRSVVFHEILAWDPAVAEGVAQAAAERLRALPADLAQRGVEVWLAAHAPYSVSPALFTALQSRGGIRAMHLAESAAESRFLDTGDGEWRQFLRARGLAHVCFEAPHQSPVRYAAGLGLLSSSLLLAHCVRVDAEDRQLLARSGASVVCCPTSNRNLDVGRAPVPELIADGVRLCLGTDSLASGDSLDVLNEVVVLHRQFPDLSASTLVRMATLAGAQALGLPDLGAIEPGKRAALAFAPAPRAPSDALRFLVSGEAHLKGFRA